MTTATETEVVTRPIIFSASMVKALLADRKVQTRRIVKWTPGCTGLPKNHLHDFNRAWADPGFPDDDGTHRYGYLKVPFAHPDDGWEADPTDDVVTRVYCEHSPGDRLWVKENWRTFEHQSDCVDGILYAADGAFVPIGNTAEAADLWVEAHDNGKHKGRWRPSIFMPRWASRLTLEIDTVRAERLQDITHRDAVAEGWPGAEELLDPEDTTSHFAGATKGDWIRGVEDGDDACIEWFADLWESINGKGAWEANPWTWVISFHRVEV